jgi:hypothetical protein
MIENCSMDFILLYEQGYILLQFDWNLNENDIILIEF